MRQNDLKQLRLSWGDKPCKHPKIDKEYDLGAHTGDYVCTTCGKEFSKQEKNEIEEKNNVKKTENI